MVLLQYKYNNRATFDYRTLTRCTIEPGGCHVDFIRLLYKQNGENKVQNIKRIQL